MKLTLLFLLTLTFFPQTSFTYSTNSSMITDLTSSNPSDFLTETSSWSLSSSVCPTCNQTFTIPQNPCGISQETILGGPNILGPSGLTAYNEYFFRQYPNLGSYPLYIAIEYDTWVFTNTAYTSSSPSNALRLNINTKTFSLQTSSKETCEINYTDGQGASFSYLYKFHTKSWYNLTTITATAVNISVINRLTSASSTNSIGFKNLQVYMYSSDPPNGFTTTNFPCGTGSGWNGNSCSTCHSYCKTCFGSTNDECSTCQTAYFYYNNGTCLADCNNPFASQTVSGAQICQKICTTGFYWAHNQSCSETCTPPLLLASDEICSSPCSSGQFLYPNGSCFADCPSPFQQQIDSLIVQFCLNPCSPSEYLYANGSCLSDCPFPLQSKSTGGIVSCENPCDPLTKFLASDGSCVSECDSPLIPQLESTVVKYCRNPCYGTAVTTFLYPNSSCLSSCPSPLFIQTQADIQYCYNPCSENNTYLSPNQLCLPSCSSPNKIISQESLGNFCQFPCENPSHYFYEPTQQCQPTCPSPYLSIESPLPKLCISTLSQEEVQQVKQLAQATNTANSVSSTGITVLSIISSSDSTAACIGPMAKMLQYIKFMNIAFPEKVQLMLKQQSGDSGGFTKKFMGDVLDEFLDHTLPGRFQTYKIPSSFFVNFWPTLFNLSVILLVTLIVLFLTVNIHKSSKVHGILQSLLEVLKWNAALITFCGSLGDVVLFTALELQTVHFDGSSAIISFVLCLSINILAVYVVVKILEVNLAIRKSKENLSGGEEEKKEIERKWCSYRALFECYRDYSYSQQIFLFVFIIRLALFNGMIGYLYQYPLFQAVIFALSNIIMLLYLVIKRPMKKIVNLVQQITLELMLLPFNTCVLILAIMDEKEIEAVDQRKKIGDVIVYINLIVPFLSIGLMAAKIVAIGIEFYLQRKTSKTRSIKRFNVETARPKITVNTTQGILPSHMTISSSSRYEKSPIENTQILSTTTNMDSFVSPENSLIFYNNTRPSPVRYSNNNTRRRARMHHPDLILPEIHQEEPRMFPLKDLNFQGRRNPR